MVLGCLGQDLLWVTTIQETTEGFSSAGEAVRSNVLRFERHGDNILLRHVRMFSRSESTDATAASVDLSNLAPVIRSLPIKASGKDQSILIDATGLFTRDVKDFSAVNDFDVGGMGSSRSFVSNIMSFPTNIEVETLAIYGVKGVQTNYLKSMKADEPRCALGEGRGPAHGPSKMGHAPKVPKRIVAGPASLPRGGASFALNSPRLEPDATRRRRSESPVVLGRPRSCSTLPRADLSAKKADVTSRLVNPSRNGPVAAST